MPLLERAGERGVVQPRRLASELDALQLELQAGVRAVGVEHAQDQGVQRGQEGDIRPFAERMAQRQRAVRGQLGQQPIGDRPQTFVFLRLDGGRWVGRSVAAGFSDSRRRVLPGLDHHLRLLDRQFVLWPNITALDPQRPVRRDADEGAGAGDPVGVERDRMTGKRLDRGLEFAHAAVLLFGQLLRFGRGRLDILHLLLECGQRRLLLRRERHGVAAELAQAVGVAVGEVRRDLHPAPAFGAHGDRLLAELLGHHLVDQADVLQPAAVIALEQVVQDRAAGLGIGVHADEPRPLVRRPHRALGQHAPDGVGGLVVGLAQPLEHLLLAGMIAVGGEGHQLVQAHAVLPVDVEQPGADRRQPQPLLHHGDRHELTGGDLLLGLPLLAERQEGAELVQRMQRRALDVLRQRVLLGQAVGSNHTGDRRGLGQPALLDQRGERPVAPAACRDLVHAGLHAGFVHDGAHAPAH